MQKLTLGGDELTLVASPITPWIYKKAFGQDLISELAAMSGAEDVAGNVDIDALGMFTLIQMAWAMMKTANPAKVPDFDSWLESLPEDALDFSALDLAPVLLELQRGFFRGAKGDTATSEEPDVDTE